MNKQKQIDAAARLEGIEEGYEYYSDEGVCHWHHGDPVPDYFNDSNAIDRLVDGMSIITRGKYCELLFGMKPSIGDLMLGVAATCEQKLEFVLKACGVWEGEAAGSKCRCLTKHCKCDHKKEEE